MPIPTEALIGGGARILGGLIGSSGQEDANKANTRLAREQMRFQERMSSTAYQRAAGDLEKAGLNRILALGSPASTPSGQTAIMQNTGAEIGAAVGDAPNSALALKTQGETIKNIKASTANTAEDTLVKQGEQTVQKATIDNLNAQAASAREVQRGNEIENDVQQKIYDTMGVAGKALGQISPALAALVGALAGGATRPGRGKKPTDKKPKAKPETKAQKKARLIEEAGPVRSKKPNKRVQEILQKYGKQ